ncbi:molybdate ABC transporter substrate-binding protein [Paenibacillus alba]|uniref:Molybdate ABC transporter substrate-binding protein n=1 Tax=Paenibacillus alba TaxID=1197127 RepID=A0ABU6GBV5_9BACL|nr:molybdate ABC transporter substrate-binding protein [Paenibacillus alba]MEC0231666.1 molybdate ABC transporter substrate-binding protein [Paenibacillus alba]NQX69977.1 molybdate ABC transporter substrate-binding protein [Paenibacillus alba]
MSKLLKASTMLSALTLAAVIFTGCSSQKAPAPVSSPSAQATPTASASVEKVELTISAAASLTDALKEIQTNFESKNKQLKLNFNFGASGALQQQIEQGAPSDMFLSAATKNMKALVDKQLIDAAQQKNLLINELVVVTPADGKVAVQKIDELSGAEIKHVAVGEPQTVPAGSYAKEALTSAKLWDSLQSKLVQGKDVRQVLTYVESGNAEAGFVYKTDALTSKQVKVAFSVDPKTYTPIEYPIGIVKATKHSKEINEFYTYLQSKEAQDVFVKFGFSIPK